MSSSKRQRYWGRITGKDENNSSNRINNPAPDQAPSQPGIPSTSPSSSTISLRSRDSRRLSTSSNFQDVLTAPLESRTIHSAPKPDEDRERALPDLWAKAADVLKSDPDPEKRTLIEQYSATLKQEIGPSKMDDCATPFLGLQPGQAAKLLNAKAEELKNRKMTVGSGKHAVEVEPHFNNVAKHIITAKDLINSAAGADPHASVACAGVIVILTFLIRQIEQREQLFKGLDLVSSIICRYLVMETVFRPRIQVDSVSKATARDLERDFENNLVNLYAKILEFQARALSYVQRSRPSQFFRDTFRGDTWKTLIADIKDLDGQCRAFADLVTDEKLHSFLDNQRQSSNHSEPRTHAEIAESEQLQRQRAECLRLLDTCPYRDRKDINPERAVGTCEWFIDHDLFRAWMNSTRPSILWVSADPGCGKSVLAKFLVDEILPNKIKDSALCYFFFKEDFADQRTLPVALCSILRQLFLNRPSLLTPKRMTQFTNEGKRLTESTSSLFEMLFALAGENDVQICCLIDALDECEESDRRKFISALDKFYMNPDDRQRLKVIVTSRPEMMIQRQFRRLEKNWPKIHLRGEDDGQLAKISHEIDVFARSRIQCITESIPLEPLETQFLQQEISNTKNRTYLWVKMVLDVIENVLAFTTDKAAEILAGLPKGLDMLYEKILNRCQDIKKARNVLQIVIAAVRPLTLEEMAVALAMSTDEHLNSRIKLEPPSRFKETLRAICGLFVTIIDDKIYFIHQTAKEFLARDLADSNVPRLIKTPNESVGSFYWKHSFAHSESNAVLAKACMRYLGSRMGRLAIQGFRLSKVEPDPHNVFFEYSALFWPIHISNSGDAVGDEIQLLATALCESCCSETSDSWFSKWLLMKGYRHMAPDAPAMPSPSLDVYYMEENWIIPLKPTPIIVAVICGLAPVVRTLHARNEQSILERDERGRTAFWWAARQGQADFVRLLLCFDISDDAQRDFRDSVINSTACRLTPLMVASAFEHLQTVRALLQDPRVDPHTRDWNMRTVVDHAFDHEDVVNVLFDYNSTCVGLEDDRLWDYFLKAIRRAYVGPATVIAQAMSPDFQTKWGSQRMSPFTAIIVSWGVLSDPDSPRPRETKLDVLKAIHKLNKFDPSSLDAQRRSPAWWAAESPGNLDVLEWLVSDVKVEPDQPSNSKQTPFSRAAAHFSKDKLEILWNTGKVNVNASDLNKRTPLFDAIVSGDREDFETTEMIETVRWLISIGADVNHKDTELRTALMHAAKAGFKRVVETLIGHGASLDMEDLHGQTALILAQNAEQSGGTILSFLEPLGDPEESHHAVVIELLLKAGARNCTKREFPSIFTDYDVYY